jgi:hypothetical protein
VALLLEDQVVLVVDQVVHLHFLVQVFQRLLLLEVQVQILQEMVEQMAHKDDKVVLVNKRQ